MFPVGFTTPAAQVIVMTLVSVCFQVLQVYLQPWRPLANLIDAVLSTPPSVLRALQLPEQGSSVGATGTAAAKGAGGGNGPSQGSSVGATGTADAKGAGCGNGPSKGSSVGACQELYVIDRLKFVRLPSGHGLGHHGFGSELSLAVQRGVGQHEGHGCGHRGLSQELCGIDRNTIGVL
jgi:hypothetical protein